MKSAFRRPTWKMLGVVLGVLGPAVVGFAAGRARASGIPDAEVLRYSGMLQNADGTPLAGPRNVQVVFWSSPVETDARVCQTESEEQELSDGRFSVALPDECADAVRDNSNVWVEVLVDGTSLGRAKIGAVPYAVEAERAGRAGGLLAQQIVPAGAVMAFDLPACPPGWTEFAPARGRALIGVTTGLTRGTAVGTNSLKLSVAQLPAHSHTGTTEGGNPMTYRSVGLIGVASNGTHSPGWTGTSNFEERTDANYALSSHTHSFTTEATGNGAAIDNRQESVPLLFCRKS